MCPKAALIAVLLAAASAVHAADDLTLHAKIEKIARYAGPTDSVCLEELLFALSNDGSVMC